MKKHIISMFMLAVAAFASCSKVETPEEAPVPNYGEADVIFSVDDYYDGMEDTKAVKKSWKNGDEIMVFFYEKAGAGQQAKLRREDYEWKLVERPKGLGLSPGDFIRFEAIHFPGTIIYDPTKDNEEQLNYQGGPVRMAWKRYYEDGSASYCRAEVLDDGEIYLGKLSLKETLWDEFQVVVPGISVEDGYVLSVVRDTKYQTPSNLSDQYTTYSGYNYPYINTDYCSLTNGGGYGDVKGVSNSDGVAFVSPYNTYCISHITDSDEFKYIFCLSDGETIYYYTIPKGSTKTLGVGKAIKLPTFDGKTSKVNWKTSLTVGNKMNGHEYIDLGVVVNGKKIMWATTNVGAGVSTDNGGLYAWGSKTQTSAYTWSYYRFSDGSSASSPKMTKYVTDKYYGTVDNKSELEPDDDVAREYWEGTWRIPTKAEFEALKNQCKWTYSSSTDGWVVKGSNGNTIFIPNNESYWTSTLDGGNNRRAYAIYDDGEYNPWLDKGDRCKGMHVRPVFTE